MSVEQGVGAWRIPPGGYKINMTHADDDRVMLVAAGIQTELVRRQLLAPQATPFGGHWGPKTDGAVRDFQYQQHLFVDGVFGPKTARMFYDPILEWWENQLVIPGRLLYGQAAAESGLDPGAQGTSTPLDRGLCQINLTANPDVTDALAYGNAGFCVQRSAANWDAARTKAVQISGMASGSTLVVNCAIASHNSPALAQQWAREGRPPFVASRTVQIADYVQAVRNAATGAP